MIAFNSGYRNLDTIKLKIQKMSNKILIKEWRNVRLQNSFCFPEDLCQCQVCLEKKNCLDGLIYEELLTEEIICRGLFHFAILSLQKNQDNGSKSYLKVTTLLNLKQKNPPN